MDDLRKFVFICAGAIVAALTTTSLSFCAHAASQVPPDDSQPSVNAASTDNVARSMFVLTRLGAIIEGRLVDRGQAYTIELPNGGSARVSKLDVLFVGDSRESIYRYRASQTHLEDVNETLKFVDWASRNRLGAEAIKTLEERLAKTSDSSERRAFEKKLADIRRAEALRQDAARILEERRANPSAQTYEKTTNVKVDQKELAELETWIQEVPNVTIDRFSRRAQPILQRRCGKGGCHDDQTYGAKFRVRPKGIGSAQRLATLYNLQQTTAFLNFDNPDASLLLNHPSLVDARGEPLRPFGSDRTSEKDAQTLAAWVASTTGETKLRQAASAYRSLLPEDTNLRPNAASRYDRIDRDDVSPVGTASENAASDSVDFTSLYDQNAPQGFDESNPFRQGVSQEALQMIQGGTGFENANDPNSEEAALQRVGLRPQKEYRDAFDPMIFNDRYYPQPQTTP